MQSEDSLYHFLLICSAFENIRNPFLQKLTTGNDGIELISDNNKLMTIAILDPESNFLPDQVRKGWKDLDETYKIARDFAFHMFKKRKVLTDKYDKQQSENEQNNK